MLFEEIRQKTYKVRSLWARGNGFGNPATQGHRDDSDTRDDRDTSDNEIRCLWLLSLPVVPMVPVVPKVAVSLCRYYERVVTVLVMQRHRDIGTRATPETKGTPVTMTTPNKPNSDFEDEKKRLQIVLKRKLKRAQRLLHSAKETALNSLEWEKIAHVGLLLQSHFHLLKKGNTDITVADWENENKEISITLDPLLDPKTEIENRFKKSRKLRRAGEHAQRLTEKAELEINNYSKLLTELTPIGTATDLESFRKQHHLQLPDKSYRSKTSQPAGKALPYRQFYTAAGFRLWVGKSAKNNDTLTFSCANGSDWWLHVRNFPGSHVILRCGKHQEPDQDSIQDAIQLAIAYSKAKNQGEAEVCLTQCKFVTRYGKGKAGKVQISKHQIIHARFDQERFQRLKERSSIIAC